MQPGHPRHERGAERRATPGNHDIANAANVSVAHFYDQYFPPSRYEGFPWYGGYLGDPTDGVADGAVNRLNKDNYALFSAGGMDFLVIQPRARHARRTRRRGRRT